MVEEVVPDDEGEHSDPALDNTQNEASVRQENEARDVDAATAKGSNPFLA